MAEFVDKLREVGGDGFHHGFVRGVPLGWVERGELPVAGGEVEPRFWLSTGATSSVADFFNSSTPLEPTNTSAS